MRARCAVLIHLHMWKNKEMCCIHSIRVRACVDSMPNVSHINTYTSTHTTLISYRHIFSIIGKQIYSAHVGFTFMYGFICVLKWRNSRMYTVFCIVPWRNLDTRCRSLRKGWNWLKSTEKSLSSFFSTFQFLSISLLPKRTEIDFQDWFAPCLETIRSEIF